MHGLIGSSYRGSIGLIGPLFLQISENAPFLIPMDNADYTLRMNYMNRQDLCTVIYVDFKHERISIENHTNKIPLRAFGVLENPSWEDFQIFLEDRCLPRTRAGLKEILRDMGVPFYDPLLIIENTQGRIAGDNQWIALIPLKQSE